MAASVRRQHTTSCWSPGTAVCSITTRRWCSPARRVRHDCRAGRQGRSDSGVLRRRRGREVRAPALPRGPFQRAASGAVHDVREHIAALGSRWRRRNPGQLGGGMEQARQWRAAAGRPGHRRARRGTLVVVAARRRGPGAPGCRPATANRVPPRRCRARGRAGVRAGVSRVRARVDRASPADLMQLATDVGPAPMNVGSVLVLGPGPRLTIPEAERVLTERIEAVPRFRQRLRRAPPGCGRPYWADDPGFDPRQHVRWRDCPQPGDQRALLDMAAALLTEPLPRSRPLWTATLVTGLADGTAGLVLVMNHVLADGVGGLAVLAQLADEISGPARLGMPAVRFPIPPPRVRTLAADAWTGRARRLSHPASTIRTIRQGISELGGAGQSRRLPRTSLNRPVGPRRRFDVVAADLSAIREFGHARGGSVSDVLAAAAAGGLHALLAGRGERLELATISMPVSARQVASAAQLGNQVGVMPVTLPAAGELSARVPLVAAITRDRKQAARGTSAALLGPVFRLLAPTGLLRWLIDRQRLIHAFATYLHGPAEPVSFAGAPVTAVIPLIGVTGNVPVAFVALSYAGTLRITVASDPGRVPDVAVLTAALRHDMAEA